jgi:hypothetical protein
MLQGPGHIFGFGRCRQANGATAGLVHQPAAGYVVGVGVGIEAGHQVDGQLSD